VNRNGSMNIDDMNYLLDKLQQIADILTKLQMQHDLLSLRVDLLQERGREVPLYTVQPMPEPKDCRPTTMASNTSVSEAKP